MKFILILIGIIGVHPRFGTLFKSSGTITNMYNVISLAKSYYYAHTQHKYRFYWNIATHASIYFAFMYKIVYTFWSYSLLSD